MSRAAMSLGDQVAEIGRREVELEAKLDATVRALEELLALLKGTEPQTESDE